MEKLKRQISESISNYSLEKANEEAGVATPKRSALNSPLASSSSSVHSSPIKAASSVPQIVPVLVSAPQV